MKYSTEILIIGGGPAAAVAAGTARRYYSDKEVTVIKICQEQVIIVKSPMFMV